MSGSLLILSAESNEFSTSSRIVVYRHFPGCTSNHSHHVHNERDILVTEIHTRSRETRQQFATVETTKRSISNCNHERKRVNRRILRTLSKPAIFLLSAKNSAGLFCCKRSLFPWPDIVQIFKLNWTSSHSLRNRLNLRIPLFALLTSIQSISNK